MAYGNSNVAVFLASFGANSINTTGNVRANNFTGNGTYLRNIPGANVVGRVPFANVANRVAVANVTGIGNIATINRDGNSSNVLYGNGVFGPVSGATDANITALLANFGSNVISTTGNVTVGNIIGNGQSLTSVPGANVTGQVPYANIANRVAVSNVQGIGNIATLNRDGNASNVLYGNGVFAAAPNTGSNYGNSNVALYLANYGSNNITTSGNVTAGNISGKFFGNGVAISYINGSNVTGQVPYANIANRVAVANVTGIGNIATINRDGNSSNVLYGNGQFAAVTASYTNTNVATFLANYGSNTITTTGNVVVGNISANNLGNVSALNLDGNYQNVLYGNGVFGPVSSASYGNSNVINLLVSFGNNRISTTGNVNVGNIIGNGQALTGLRGSNIIGAVQYATIANSVAVANVSGLGNVATLNRDGNSQHVLYGNGVFANLPSIAEPAGSNGEVQYNANGDLGAIPTIVYDSDNSVVSLGNIENISLGGGTDGYVLQTDGNGALAWTQPSTFSGTVASYIVSDISIANIAVATTENNHSFVNGTSIVFVDAAGGNDWANINNETYYAGNVTSNTFEVYTDLALTTGLDTSGFVDPYTANSANVLYVVSSTPGGINGTIQYNDAGQLGGSSKFTVDGTAGNLSVTGNIIATQSIRVSGYGGNITGAVDISAIGNVVASNIIANINVTETLTSNLITTDQLYFNNTGAVTISSNNDLNFSAVGTINYSNPIGLSVQTNDDIANLSATVGSLVYNSDNAGVAYYTGSSWVTLTAGDVPSGNNIVVDSITTNQLTFSGLGAVIINGGSDLSFQPAGQIVFGSLATMVSLTVAELANVSGSVGSFAYCTDANGGACPVYYNGTTWLKFSDNGNI